jgi:hypothetical protein
MDGEFAARLAGFPAKVKRGRDRQRLAKGSNAA